MGKLYRLDVPSGNGVLASLICTKNLSKRPETVAALQDFTYRYGLEYNRIGGHRSDPAPPESQCLYFAAVRNPAPPPLSGTVPAGFRLRPSKLKACRFFSTMHWITTVLLFLLKAAP